MYTYIYIYTAADILWHIYIHISRQLSYGRCIMADMVWQIDYGRYITADILRPTQTPICQQVHSARSSRLLHSNQFVATYHPSDPNGDDDAGEAGADDDNNAGDDASRRMMTMMILLRMMVVVMRTVTEIW